MPIEPGLWIEPGMMPILHSPGVMMPGQFGPMSRVADPLMHGLDLDHVEHRHAFRDADDELDAGIGRLENRVGRERRRHVDHADGRARGLLRLGHRVEDRQIQMLSRRRGPV